MSGSWVGLTMVVVLFVAMLGLPIKDWYQDRKERAEQDRDWADYLARRREKLKTAVYGITCVECLGRFPANANDVWPGICGVCLAEDEARRDNTAFDQRKKESEALELRRREVAALEEIASRMAR